LLQLGREIHLVERRQISISSCRRRVPAETSSGQRQAGTSAGFWLGEVSAPLPPEAKKILKI